MKRGKVFIGVLIFTLTLISLALAQTTNPWTSDFLGNDKTSFTIADKVYLTSYTICFPPAENTFDVYIIGATNLSSGDNLTDVRGSPQQIKTDKSGFIKTTQIWATPKGGDYVVVLDCNNNGLYDNEPTDAVNGLGFTIQEAGSLSASLGENSPSDFVISYDSENPQNENTLMQLNLKASDNEDVLIKSIKLSANGTGNDVSDVKNVIVYADENDNGIKDANDSEIGSGVFNEDDGSATLNMNYTIVKGASENLIIDYVLSSFTTGKTYSFSLDSIAAQGASTNMATNISGLPLTSAVMVIGTEKLCKGDVKVLLGVTNTYPNTQVMATVLGLQNCTGKTASIKLKSCSGLDICNCTIQDSLCTCNFLAPDVGTYAIFGCVDKNDDLSYTGNGESIDTILIVNKKPETNVTTIPAPPINITNTTTATNNLTKVVNPGVSIVTLIRNHAIATIGIVMAIMFILLIIILVMLIKLMRKK